MLTRGFQPCRQSQAGPKSDVRLVVNQLRKQLLRTIPVIRFDIVRIGLYNKATGVTVLKALIQASRHVTT